MHFCAKEISVTLNFIILLILACLIFFNVAFFLVHWFVPLQVVYISCAFKLINESFIQCYKYHIQAKNLQRPAVQILLFFQIIRNPIVALLKNSEFVVLSNIAHELCFVLLFVKKTPFCFPFPSVNRIIIITIGPEYHKHYMCFSPDFMTSLLGKFNLKGQF